MSGFFYKYLEVSRTTGLNLTSADLRLLMIDSAVHTINPATDQYLDDIPSAARVGVTGTLTGAVASGREFDADDATMFSVSGNPSEVVVLWHYTGTESTSLLICYWDGLSVTPNGGDIAITFGTPMWS